MSETSSHLVFACGSSWYALPAERAEEVVTYGVLTRVPGAPSHVSGVFAHRGEVVPVVDLSVMTGGPAEGTSRAVLVRMPKGTFALTARKVAGVSQFSSALSPLGENGIRAHLRGPAVSGEHEVALIEPEGLFNLLCQSA